MLGRRYTVELTEATLTAATDLIQILVPSDMSVLLVGVEVSSKSLVADEWEIEIIRGNTGNTVTPIVAEKSVPGDPTASVLVYDSTGETDLTQVGLPYWSRYGDVRAPVIFQRAPDDGMLLVPSEKIAIRSNLAVTSLAVRCVAEFIELG